MSERPPRFILLTAEEAARELRCSTSTSGLDGVEVVRPAYRFRTTPTTAPQAAPVNHSPSSVARRPLDRLQPIA